MEAVRNVKDHAISRVVVIPMTPFHGGVHLRFLSRSSRR
jgi:hypothetical protein